MKFILGTKLGMTQVFRQDGTVVPVTRVQAGPCVVTQVKTAKKDGVGSVQVGFGSQKKFRLNKAMRGHLKDLSSVRFIREFRTDLTDTGLERGDTFTVKVFAPGDKVQVVGKSKGKGFQGVVKRHGFAGSPATHGHKDQLRMPGSIGAGGVQRVFKGKRMAGHMGDARITVKNLEIVEVHEDAGELLIKGAVPGARGSLLIISSDEGTMEVQKETEAPAQEEVQAEPEMPANEDQKEESTVSTEETSEAPAAEEKTEEENKDVQ
ncbi:MAG: 50S ribosomal protein L3 [Candidatus Magasanikbacteria bacterium CG11_big_fil_rev_8_21_14_0_20_39_34]|uniref:Large ribosomal subunit protein uL3 n=1 Tax=Candidatus Magasanikbacteria bacterium CG11_big_fil_rev_8_21_14_0_20_39_34 TaxID=1974653 RepID=A0A2H0N3U2_9BACT|nr:MAG: 50S ribosomal protein L3 [Candidatus Magasanikbacteria bacterium CG11_big_fil_rev_8_21_14_0_20_39_34]